MEFGTMMCSLFDGNLIGDDEVIRDD
jgi:hypothetical protein